jgi:hypothetical protein
LFSQAKYRSSSAANAPQTVAATVSASRAARIQVAQPLGQPEILGGPEVVAVTTVLHAQVETAVPVRTPGIEPEGGSVGRAGPAVLGEFSLATGEERHPLEQRRRPATDRGEQGNQVGVVLATVAECLE